jgi:mannose-6-phosphate isomerase-like protein (cupin superfamily)
VTVTTTNQSITPDTRPVVAELNRFATRPEVLAALRRAKADAEKQLQRDPDLSTTFVALDPLQFGSATPDAIGSIRVVVTRDGGGDSLERHSNSTQYLFVLDGPVETHVESTDGWRVDRYGYGGATDLEDQWHVVPPGVWHKSVAPGARNWAIVAFHSARQVSDEYRQGKR